MTVRITRTTADGRRFVRVEGRLEGAEASALCDELNVSPAELTLDLSGLLSADSEGVRVLRSLRDKGAQLTGESVYIRHLLAGHTDATAD